MKKVLLVFALLISISVPVSTSAATENSTYEEVEITTEDKVVLEDGTIIEEISVEEYIQDIIRLSGKTREEVETELSKIGQLNSYTEMQASVMSTTTYHMKKISHPITVDFTLLQVLPATFYNIVYVSYEVRGPGLNVNVTGVNSIYNEPSIQWIPLIAQFRCSVADSDYSYWGDTVSWEIMGKYQCEWLVGIAGTETEYRFRSYNDVVM